MTRLRRLLAHWRPWIEDVLGAVALMFLAYAGLVAAGVMQP